MNSHKSFKKAASLMLVAVLLSRILGLVREIIIAKQFGQGGDVSAFTSAFNLPDLLYFFLSSGALSSAFIPVFTERFNTGRQKEAWQIFSIIACLMGIVLTIAIVLFWVFAKPLVSVLAVPGFVDKYPQLVDMTVLLTKIILPCQLFFFIGGLMMGTLESRQKFSARAAGPVIYNIGIIFGAIVLSRWFDIAGLAWGALIGSFAGNVVYAYYCLRKEGYEFHPSLNFRHPGVVKVAQLALPVILGLSLPQIDIIINKYFASFVSDAAPAALNYANRLMQVPLGIFAQAAGTAILPMLAAYAAERKFNEMRSGLAYGLRTILVENIPATLFMVVMADPIVRTVYMSGLFKPSDVPVTAVALAFYSAGIFAWAGQAIVARGFFALQDTVSPVVIGTVSTAIFIPMNFFLMKYMGIAGIALSTTLAAILHFLLLTYFLRKRLNGLEGTRTIKTAGRILVAAIMMAIVCFGVRLGMSNLIGSWQLQDGDVKNPYRFAIALKDGRDPLSAYLQSSLSDKTRVMESHYQAMNALAAPMEAALNHDLNLMMDSPKFYDKARFERVTLGGSAAKFAKNGVRNISEQREFNRGLLEATFPDAIAKSADRGWLSTQILGKKESRVTANDGSSWLLNGSDIRNLTELAIKLDMAKRQIARQEATRLVASEDIESQIAWLKDKESKVKDIDHEVCMYIISQLSRDTLDALSQYTTDAKACAGMSESLMHDLNGVIANKDLHVFAQGKLESVKRPLAKVNRLVIEAAYPSEVVKRPLARVESRMASMITVLAAMLFGGIVYFVFLRLLKVDEADFVWNMIQRKILRRSV